MAVAPRHLTVIWVSTQYFGSRVNSRFARKANEVFSTSRWLVCRKIASERKAARNTHLGHRINHRIIGIKSCIKLNFEDLEVERSENSAIRHSIH